MSSPTSGWISYWEHNLLGDQPQQQPDFAWSDPRGEDDALKVDSLLYQIDSVRTDSTDYENSRGDRSTDNRKRARDDGSNAMQGKAGREKLRRDRMNDRFVELSAVLEPDKPPKTDKASILRDAARIISQLRAETLHFKDTNIQLQDTIRELKAEKNELREEKLSLKAEKEILEKRLKSCHGLPGYAAHALAPAAQVASGSSPFASQSHALYPKLTGAPATSSGVQATGVSSSFTSQNHTFYAKPAGTSPYAYSQYTFFPKSPVPEIPYLPRMSEFIPPEVADVSNDHVLRPPVA